MKSLRHTGCHHQGSGDEDTVSLGPFLQSHRPALYCVTAAGAGPPSRHLGRSDTLLAGAADSDLVPLLFRGACPRPWGPLRQLWGRGSAERLSQTCFDSVLWPRPPPGHSCLCALMGLFHLVVFFCYFCLCNCFCTPALNTAIFNIIHTKIAFSLLLTLVG